jgi:octaprenyl-diphosphate synthase
MVHMATLVHDDVLDDAEIRRRGQTVNALRGNEAAVILGDYLLASAYHLCSRSRAARPPSRSATPR